MVVCEPLAAREMARAELELPPPRRLSAACRQSSARPIRQVRPTASRAEKRLVGRTSRSEWMSQMIDLEPATSTLGALVEHMRDDQLNAPTPCAGTSLGDLLDHVDGLSRAFTA